MRLEKSKTFLLLLLCGSMTQTLSAFDKKAAVPATATPTKTAKILVSRLTAPRVEEAKPKKNAPAAVLTTKLKEAPKPVAVAKFGNQERRGVRNSERANNAKVIETAKGKTAQSAKLQAAKSPVLVKGNKATLVNKKSVQSNLLAANVSDGQRKGKFGRENRDVEPTTNTTRIKVTPADPVRSNKPVEQPARTIRPRGNDEVVKETPAQPRVSDSREAEPRDSREPQQERIAQERIADAPKMPIATPDRIEVIEQTSPVLSQLLALPTARPSAPYGAIVTRTGTPPPARKDVSIPQQRIFEIQYELSKRGFYTAEPNGLYDDATVAAMWEFQKNYGLPATGYPTAHALKRLGLTSW